MSKGQSERLKRANAEAREAVRAAKVWYQIACELAGVEAVHAAYYGRISDAAKAEAETLAQMAEEDMAAPR